MTSLNFVDFAAKMFNEWLIILVLS